MAEIIDRVEKLLELMRTNDIEELEIKEGDFSIKLRRNISELRNSSPQEIKDKEKEEENIYEVKSFTVGVFRFPNNEEEMKEMPEGGINPGVVLKEKSLLGVIEGINEAHNEKVYAGKEGILEEICVKERQVVGWGEVLFKIKLK